MIYSTAPVQRIVGMFEIDTIDKTSPTRAWKKYGRVGGIEQTPFERYYTGAAHAYVIRVRHPRRFDAPVTLADLDPTMRPPQSYMYLTVPVLERLDRLATPVANCTPRISRCPSLLTPVATMTETLRTRPPSRTFIVNASAATKV